MIPEIKRRAHEANMRRHDSIWNKKFEKIKNALAANSDEQSLAKPLRSWLSRSRRLYKLNQMSDARKQTFETLGPAVVRNKKTTWDEAFAELQSYLDENDGVYPHYQTEDKLTEQGLRLREWCNEQRRHVKNFLEKKGNTGSITKGKMKRLESIHFPNAVSDNRWKEIFEQLKVFYAENGHSIVPVRDSQNSTLGRWVDKQRYEFRKYSLGQKSNLTAERINKLNTVNFVWNVPEYRWNQYLESVVLSIKKDPFNPKFSTFQKRWIARQRKNYQLLCEGKKSPITKFRLNRLKKFGLLS